MSAIFTNPGECAEQEAREKERAEREAREAMVVVMLEAETANFFNELKLENRPIM